MTPALDAQLRAAYPLVFPRPLLNDEPIRCGDGWLALLTTLASQLQELIEAEPEAERAQYRAVQVKEKFGTLRFYTDRSTPPMSALIDIAESTSARVCDVCSKPAELRSGTNTHPLVRTRCDEHIDWREPVAGLAHG